MVSNESMRPQIKTLWYMLSITPSSVGSNEIIFLNEVAGGSSRGGVYGGDRAKQGSDAAIVSAVSKLK
jgi:hypothetical protein